MSDYWVPSGPYVQLAPATGSASFVVASNQLDGVARVFNINDATAAIVAIVSVSATAGEAKYVPIAPTGVNISFFAFSGNNVKVLVSNATCLINPGYMLK